MSCPFIQRNKLPSNSGRSWYWNSCCCCCSDGGLISFGVEGGGVDGDLVHGEYKTVGLDTSVDDDHDDCEDESE